MSTTLSRRSGSRSRSPLFLGSRVFFQRGALARRLAEGVRPASSPELERRAEQLLSTRHRRVLAEGLENLIDAAAERPIARSSVVPLRRAAILSERQAVLALAVDLRDTDEQVSARGVALVERMITDGRSPFYVDTGEESLGVAIGHARSAPFLG